MGVEMPSKPINRHEQYLAKIAGQAVDIPAEPNTREEAYLDYIAKHGGGGGGGTNDYNDLLNQPKINNNTLVGNKSAEDLGLADKTTVENILNGQDIDSFGDVETALANKQGNITAGTYIQMNGDTISVKRDISQEVDEVLTLSQSGSNLIATLSLDGTVLESQTFTQAGGTFLDLVTINFNVRAVRWYAHYLKASKTHSAGADEYLSPGVDYTDTFVVTIGEDYKLIIKSELDDAMSTKQDVLTFDDVPTANSNNPVKSGGVKSAIDAAVASAYHHAGTKTCAELVAGLLVAANEGNVYNMTDSGTTTADFIEGAGQPIKAGDNVGVAKISDGVYKFDLLSGFVDTTNFVQKSQTAGLLKNDGTVDTTIQGDVSTLKSGLTTLDTEVNGDATTYPYADVITIENAVPANLANCSVKVEPVQDLHGYDKPWVGGAGVNLLPSLVPGTYEKDGIIVTVDNNGNMNISGTKTASAVTINVPLTSPIDISANYYLHMHNDVSDSNVVTMGVTFSGTNRIAVMYDMQGVQNCVVYIASSATLNINARLSIEKTNNVTDWSPYTNICPISGHTEASVQRDGKNLFNKRTALAGYMLDTSTGEVVSGLGTHYVTDYIRVFANQTLYVPNAGSTRRCFYNLNKDYDSSVSVSTIFTPTEDGYIRITGSTYDETGISADDLQIELGSSATDYEPYKGQTYTIQLGSTIYGGTVDFDSGVMTVDRAYAKITSLTRNDNHQFYCIVSPSPDANLTTVDKLICDKIKTGNTANVDNISTNSVRAVLVNTEQAFSTASDAMTYFGGSIDICYMVNSPTTVQLTPQQIQLLQGTNTLYASTGDISVTVNGVSGSIGAVQSELSNLAADIAEQLPDAPTTDGAYVLTVTVASGEPTYSWESAE